MKELQFKHWRRKIAFFKPGKIVLNLNTYISDLQIICLQFVYKFNLLFKFSFKPSTNEIQNNKIWTVPINTRAATENRNG